MRTTVPGASPLIEPVPEGPDRPYWSVMIPSYNASEMLETTLRCVLDQDPGPDQMQIAVVDDCSPNGEAERIVQRLAPSRVEFHRNPANVGLAGNWNSCINRSRGRWLHVLHQDDVILPGFYERLGQAGRDAPEAGAAFCRNIYMDGDGHWLSFSAIERREPGLLENWISRMSQSQRIQCAAIVVRRDVYEQIGGYRDDLSLALDWEMWVRIAVHFPVWFEPRPLACWRVHAANESTRLERNGDDIRDVLKTIEIIRGYIPEQYRGEVGQELLGLYREQRMREATRLMLAGDREAGMSYVDLACLSDPPFRRSRVYWNYRKWAMKLRVKELLSPTKPRRA